MELSDAEHWVLVSLDHDAALHELLVPISVRHGKWVHRARPALDVPSAAKALSKLVELGYAEMRVIEGGDHDWDRGRPLDADEMKTVLMNPASWLVERDGDVSYWAAATDEGEAAYGRSAAARSS